MALDVQGHPMGYVYRYLHTTTDAAGGTQPHGTEWLILPSRSPRGNQSFRGYSLAALRALGLRQQGLDLAWHRSQLRTHPLLLEHPWASRQPVGHNPDPVG